jgi:hypothetical protein
VGAGPGSSGSVACRADHPFSDGRLEVECAVEVVVAVAGRGGWRFLKIEICHPGGA